MKRCQNLTSFFATKYFFSFYQFIMQFVIKFNFILSVCFIRNEKLIILNKLA